MNVARSRFGAVSVCVALVAGCQDSEAPPADTRVEQGTPDALAIDLTPADSLARDHPLPDLPPPDMPLPDLTPPDTAKRCQAPRKPCGPPAAPPCPPLDKCKNLYKGSGLRNWPTKTDASGALVSGYPGCKDSKGKTWPSIDVGAANWFRYINCGTYKDYPVHQNCTFEILSYNDCCSGCVLKNIDYDIQEQVGGKWTTIKTIRHAFTGSCDNHVDAYSPSTTSVRIQSNKGFYVCVFEK
jgi:hypothetical protein